MLWTPGSQNLTECFTKHHSSPHYQHMKAKYLHEPSMHSAHGRYHHGHCKGVLVTMTPTTGSYHRSASSLYRLSYRQHSHPACQHMCGNLQRMESTFSPTHCWKCETQFLLLNQVFSESQIEWLGKSSHSSQPTSSTKVASERFENFFQINNSLIIP